MKKSKLIFGIGLNDADYYVYPIVDGVQVMCPFYRKWRNMIERCYSEKSHKAHPTYIGCSVAKEWLLFSNFKQWMMDQDWEGRELDKDLLVHGNKIYSPETCVFVNSDTNRLLTDHGRARGDLPLGVVRSGKVYRSTCNNKGVRVSLGAYSSSAEAYEAYKKYKSKVIIEHARLLSDSRVKEGLIRIANSLKFKAA